MNRRLGAFAGTAILLGLAGYVTAFASKPVASGLYGDEPLSITVDASPVYSFRSERPEHRTIGRLHFRGGLDLQSSFRGFGGFSGLAMSADGTRLVAVSDAGSWLSAEIRYDGIRPAGFTNVRMAPLLGEQGRRLTDRGSGDAEALASLPGGDVLVSFEREDAIRRYAFGENGMTAHAIPVPAPSGLKPLPDNEGVEALAACPGETGAGPRLVAIVEAVNGGRARAWAWRPGARQEEFEIAVPNGFAVTDAVCLGGGQIILLERRFSAFLELSARLRIASLEELQRGGPGETLLVSGAGDAIDNMEGVGIHRSADGAVVLTLISDDNFNLLQRTLLLQFELR